MMVADLVDNFVETETFEFGDSIFVESFAIGVSVVSLG